MANVIELRPRDLQIKTLENGKEVVQIRSLTAFDEDFISECRAKGVKPATIEQEKEENL